MTTLAFVPYELTAEGTWLPRPDLPPFNTADEVMNFIGSHEGWKLVGKMVEWREEVVVTAEEEKCPH
jgi:hypothetical protein